MRLKVPKAKSNRRTNDAARGRQRKHTAASSESGLANSRSAQLMLRVRPDLKREIVEEALRREVSVQTLVLTALRKDGLPIKKQDLEDLRVGRTPLGTRSRAFLDQERGELRRSLRPQALAPRIANHEISEDTLETLVHVLALLGVGTGGGGISINNHCGCQCGESAAVGLRSANEQRKHKSATRRRR
jgi:hypothetical protein